MRNYSIHSHKGGVGKTTFGIFLGKYLARIMKEKTCMIDLDFIAPGLRSAYFRRNVENDFSDFLFSKKEKKGSLIKTLCIESNEVDDFYFICSLFKPALPWDERNKITHKIYLKMINESFTGEIIDSLKIIINELERNGFKNIIFDCHPGLMFLSDEIIKYIKATRIFLTTPDIVSFIGLFENIFAHINTWKLDLSKINIVFNRIVKPFSFKDALAVFLDEEKYLFKERLISSKLQDEFDKLSVSYIKEDKDIQCIDTIINGKTILSLDIPEDLVKVIKKIIKR